MIALANARRTAGGAVSLGGGTASAALVREMLSDGVLEAVSPGVRERLVISEAGRARLLRVDAGDNPFLTQHQELADEEREVGGSKVTVKVNHKESPLAWLRRRRGRDGAALIDEAAFAAGERLRADVERAQMTPRMTVNWETTASVRSAPGAVMPGDMAIAAQARVRRALDAVGPEFAGVLLDVCGFLKGIEQVERERGWPPRAGKVVLTMALGRLAGHYGIVPATGRA